MKSKGKTEEYNRQLLEKYLQGMCSEEEALEVVENFKKPQSQNKLFKSLSILWSQDFKKIDSVEKTPNLSSTLDKIHHFINISRGNDDSYSAKRIQFYKVLLRVAAVFFLPLIILSVLYVQDRVSSFGKSEVYTEVSVANGSKLCTVLPDGTIVWLNSGSTLKYPQPFSRKDRNVTLVGEAYFEVTSDDSHPFVVTTEAYDIRVTGTKFNVMAYDDDNIVSTTLEEGIVSIEKDNAGRGKSQITILKPKERIVFQKGIANFRKTVVKTDQFTSWKDGKLIFRNNSLDFIISRLERWYNSDIEIVDDKNLPQIPYTMIIKDETLEQVLEYIAIASGISSEVIPAKRMKNGEFSKKKYILHK